MYVALRAKAKGKSEMRTSSGAAVHKAIPSGFLWVLYHCNEIALENPWALSHSCASVSLNGPALCEGVMEPGGPGHSPKLEG